MKSETIISEQFYSSDKTLNRKEQTAKSSNFISKVQFFKNTSQKSATPLGSLVLAGTFLLMFGGAFVV